MTGPGIESTGKKRLPWKWIAGAGVVGGAALLALSQCDDNGQQSTSEITAVDPAKPYYTVIQDAQMRKSPESSYLPDFWVKAGSCVQGMTDGSGKQEQGDHYFRVRMENAGGDVKEGYVFMGNIGGKQLDPNVEGFSCKAEFSTQTARLDPPPVTPTFVAGETVNLHDGGGIEQPVWGALAKGSCVTVHDKTNNMVQVGIISRESSPNPVNYLWVLDNGALQPSSIPAKNCISKFTAGARAGVTLNPNGP